MLAELKSGNDHHGSRLVPLLSTAEELPWRTAGLDLVIAFNCVHHLDLGRFLTAVARVLRPDGWLCIYTRTPEQNARTIWGRHFPGFIEREQRLHSEAVPSGMPSGRPAGCRWSRHRPSRTGVRLRSSDSGTRPRAIITRHSRSTHRTSCARPLRRSRPVCPDPTFPGLTSTSCWSSAGASRTRKSDVRATSQARRRAPGRRGVPIRLRRAVRSAQPSLGGGPVPGVRIVG